MAPSADSPVTADPVAARLSRSLGDGYVIERELGGGGMSRVFVALDVSLGRRVVVKVLRDDMLEGVSRERFRREIADTAVLQHPNIVGVIAAGDAEGLPYFVMPYVDGESLRALLRRNGPLSIPVTVSVLRDIARALSFAHSRGVVHRDIKPENVLLAGGAAIVADFGVAKALVTARASDRHPRGTLTGVGMSLGTPAYMAPEQVAGDPTIDHRADLYAAGATAYEMLTGEQVFAHRTVTEQMSAHLAERAPSVTVKRPAVPAALAALITQLLEKDPGRRPQSADDLLGALDDPAVVSGAVQSAATPSMVLARRRRATRGRWRVAVVALVVAGTLGTAAFFVTRGRSTATAAAATTVDLAVFPLVSVSADSGDAYIAEGMTEALINAFTGIPGIRVASRGVAQSALSVGGAPSSVASQLKVSMFVEGTVQKSQTRIRVTVRLVNAVDGFALWSDVYERSDADVLTAQSEIAAAVAEAVSAGALEMRAR